MFTVYVNAGDMGSVMTGNVAEGAVSSIRRG